jgi:hypothetical protein
MVPRFLTAQAFDLDHFSAQASHHLRAPRSRLMATQVNHSDIVQRPFDVCHKNDSFSLVIVDDSRWKTYHSRETERCGPPFVRVRTAFHASLVSRKTYPGTFVEALQGGK